ncbi:putative response regulatory protein [compost metagenome]|nr:helix-turn-helix domain-containing protein [Paenibacillus timonensis]MUG87447.1 helix-turn-helix domain-containing protein [Paenibacillus timonensis]
MRCLLIDDDVPTVEVLRDIVRWDEYGFSQVIEAHNLMEAKSCFEAGSPDLIICDIEMPRGTGLEMIQWVREQGCDCAFIFFTCHESFDFASTALTYNADSYLIKPLDEYKLDEALHRSLESLKRRRTLGEYSRHGLAWLRNKDLVEKSFWSDVLSSTLSTRKDLIQGEIQRRDLSFTVDQKFNLVLVSVAASEIDEHWNASVFHYALSNLGSEILFNRPNPDRVIPYKQDNQIYHAFILDGGTEPLQMKASGERLVRLCKQYFKCTATCYISEEMEISQLAPCKGKLEQMDASNLIFRGIVHFQNDRFQYNTTEPFALDTHMYTLLFAQKDKMQIVKRLKLTLERLAAQNILDAATLHSMREDFLQVVYAFLAQNNIQAHQLFSDDIAKRLLQRSDHSVFDFMKWAHLMTEKAIDTLKETLQSEGVVERAKRFIHENYHWDISRDDVAASVFLTPDYLSKTFKTETGMSIIEYLNAHRIEKAKRMLSERLVSIGTIAADTGFDNLSYFSTVFKKLTGESPNAYRAKHKPED